MSSTGLRACPSWEQFLKGCGQYKSFYMEDAEKVIRSHRSIIDRAPLQAYGSALVFSPMSSEIRKTQWAKRLSFIAMSVDTRQYPDAHQQTLEGHSGAVNAVAFSPDGRYLTTNFRSLRLSPTSAPPDQRLDKHPTVQSLYVDNEWITIGGKKCLWLPSDYRSPAVAVHGNKIVLGRWSGGLTFLEAKVA